MTQSRRDSPRIPYDEAICLARIDGKGRLYGRGLDLSASGVSLLSTDSCPVGTEIKFEVLLPHGPRAVTGTIVRVTAAPSGFELAVGFGEIKPAVAAMIANLVADRADRADRAAQPAADAFLDDVQHARTKRYGTPRAKDPGIAPPTPRLPPINLPPPCGHPLPSVVVAAGFSGDEPPIEAPPRRRVPGTAAIMRRPVRTALRPATVMTSFNPLPAMIVTERLLTLQMSAWWSRARWVTVPIVAALTVAIVELGLHFSH